jgi:hypothetical protein
MRCLDHDGLLQSYRVWGGDIDCGAPELCVVVPPGSSSSTPGQPFCVLDPQPNSRCLEVKDDRASLVDRASSACADDGRTRLTCREGYVIGKAPCGSCTGALSSGDLSCSGGFEYPCQADADCAGGLVCHADGATKYCTRSCACALSAGSCLECGEVPVSQRAGEAQATPICRQGWCAY